jgi:hypothetical protein
MSAVPKGWRVVKTEMVIEPELQVSTLPVATKATSDRTGARIAVVVRPSDRSPREVAAGVLGEIAKAAPGFVRHSEATMETGDGYGVTISFDVAPGVRAVQRHVLARSTDGVVHVTLTVPEAARGRVELLEPVLRDLLTA